MAVTILSYLHNATTLLFGVYISAAFLGILINRRNILTLLGFSVPIGIIYLLSYYFLGTSGTEKIYPLIIHLPLTLFLTFFIITVCLFLPFRWSPHISAARSVTGSAFSHSA